MKTALSVDKRNDVNVERENDNCDKLSSIFDSLALSEGDGLGNCWRAEGGEALAFGRAACTEGVISVDKGGDVGVMGLWASIGFA